MSAERILTGKWDALLGGLPPCIALASAESQALMNNVYRRIKTADDLDAMETLIHHTGTFFRS